MDLLVVATLPTIAGIELVQTDLTQEEVERAIGEHLLAKNARFGLPDVEIDPIEIIILGEIWWFSETVVSGWYLLRNDNQRMLIASKREMRELGVPEGQVPMLTFANDGARQSPDNTEDECGTFKHTTAKEVLAAAALIDFLVRLAD